MDVCRWGRTLAAAVCSESAVQRPLNGRSVTSVCADLGKSIVVDAEVVRDFVADDPLHEFADFRIGVAAHENRAAVDADLVWHDQVIAVCSLSLGDAMVQSQKMSPLAHAHGLKGGAVGPFLDDDGDVLQTVKEDIGQIFYCAENQFVELFLFLVRIHFAMRKGYSSPSVSRLHCTSGPSGSVPLWYS